MSQRFEKLKNLLKELFQLDQPDLDFGFYRIMHAKSGEVTRFLERDLLPQVKAAFAQYQPADKAVLQRELAKAIEQAQNLGADPESLPKVKELRAKLADDAVDLNALEAEVFDHLYSFFRRYYSEGDFLSKRVYKPGVYAIPYEGEEVKLHWANADQYYIKTSEYLRDYAFRLRPDSEKDPMRVHFRLVDAAEGEHGNVKETEGKQRVFVLAGQDFIKLESPPLSADESKELSIHFEYRPATNTDWPEDQREGKTKPPTQKDLTALAEKQILSLASFGGEGTALAPWIAELEKPYIKADGERADYTRLQAHLNLYTARNTFDYFIHKDLGTFLRRELDFYIKNEVMHLDDIENETAPRVEQYLSKIKIIRRIAGKIIDFLAQLEDFQKKMWLKKKFVVETYYCISLACIPESFYPEIIANDAQCEEWVRLFAIDEIQSDLLTSGYSAPLKAKFLKDHPTLVLDTRNFDSSFKTRLLKIFDELDEMIDGLLIHSENFQALSVIQTRYREKVKCIYIDPPYNVPGSEILYKNDFPHSSWISLIDGRMALGEAILSSYGISCITIDDYEKHRLLSYIEALGQGKNILGVVCIRNNPSGRATVKGFAINHEYAVFVSKDGDNSELGRFRHTEDQIQRYNMKDEKGLPYELENMRKSSAGSLRRDRPKQHYALFVEKETLKVSIPHQVWDEGTKGYILQEIPLPGVEVVYPIGKDGIERVWSIGITRASREKRTLVAEISEGRIEVYKRKYLNVSGILPRTWWDKSEYSARDNGTRLLRDMLGRNQPFDFPKAIAAVEDSLRVCGLEEDEVALDYFAGSGTTGHAVINLNREDGGRRKFILVEMGDYFDTVLLSRLKKGTFTPEWKDGKPKRSATQEEAERSPRIIKVIRLESYEDTLNNLDTRRTQAQQSLLDLPQAHGPDGLKEQYLLRYMLEVETRGSQSLLNVSAFIDPTAYCLKVKLPGSDESREVSVDLLETFNWLIGLTVQHITAPQNFSAKFERDNEKRLRLKGRLKQIPPNPPLPKGGVEGGGIWWFRTVTGTTPDGRKTLVIWRKRPGGDTTEGIEQDNLVLDEWFTKQGYSSKDSEFDLIYVNGDNNLGNLKTPDDIWKVRLIEEDFHRLMFDTEGV